MQSLNAHGQLSDLVNMSARPAYRLLSPLRGAARCHNYHCRKQEAAATKWNDDESKDISASTRILIAHSSAVSHRGVEGRSPALEPCTTLLVPAARSRRV